MLLVLYYLLSSIFYLLSSIFYLLSSMAPASYCCALLSYCALLLFCGLMQLLNSLYGFVVLYYILSSLFYGSYFSISLDMSLLISNCCFFCHLSYPLCLLSSNSFFDTFSSLCLLSSCFFCQISPPLSSPLLCFADDEIV